MHPGDRLYIFPVEFRDVGLRRRCLETVQQVLVLQDQKFTAGMGVVPAAVLIVGLAGGVGVDNHGPVGQNVQMNEQGPVHNKCTDRKDQNTGSGPSVEGRQRP